MDPDMKAQVDAATAYEALFVPTIFREWAPRLIAAAGIRSGERVLDVACGTGVLAREAAATVGASGLVAGLDPNPGMLAVASRLAPRIEWRQGSAEELPYDDDSFDAVVSQFGLMFFSGRARALREMLRVLAPDGRMAVAVWDEVEHTPAYAVLVELLDRRAGKRAADALRAPFALGQRDELMALFESAAAPSPAITTHRGTARFPSVHTLVEAELRGWLPVMGVMLPETLIRSILEEADDVLRSFVTPEGAVFEMCAHIATCTKRERRSRV
jgi:ubiquinone/menaquinone biosynthesis C-methylase UbiE